MQGVPLDRQRWEGLRPLVFGVIAVAIAFQLGRESESAKSRPDEDACRAWAESIQAAAYAWRDVANALTDPAGYSDPLDRTPLERATVGADQLRTADGMSNCSFIPRADWSPSY